MISSWIKIKRFDFVFWISPKKDSLFWKIWNTSLRSVENFMAGLCLCADKDNTLNSVCQCFLLFFTV